MDKIINFLDRKDSLFKIDIDENELLKQKSFFLRNKIFAYKMDRESSVDVDEEIDFKIAQTFMTNKHV